MKLIKKQLVIDAAIEPKQCLDWVVESLAIKKQSKLPVKVSLSPRGLDYFNAMPCMLPESYNRYSLKMVYRIEGAIPPLGSDLMLYDLANGELLSVMDADWITAMRTGAVATMAIRTLRKSDTKVYSLIGLGNNARAMLLCLLESEKDFHHKVLLKAYKNQADLFVERFKDYNNVDFEVCDDIPSMFRRSDVIVSSITNATSLICEDDTCFKPGVLVVPIHLKGFQNCDLFFDKVFSDDTNHIRDFKYFDRFKSYCEIGEVLFEGHAGRVSDDERILFYSKGLGLYDAVYASKIYDKLKDKAETIDWPKSDVKFWI